MSKKFFKNSLKIKCVLSFSYHADPGIKKDLLNQQMKIFTTTALKAVFAWDGNTIFKYPIFTYNTAENYQTFWPKNSVLTGPITSNLVQRHVV